MRAATSLGLKCQNNSNSIMPLAKKPREYQPAHKTWGALKTPKLSKIKGHKYLLKMDKIKTETIMNDLELHKIT